MGETTFLTLDGIAEVFGWRSRRTVIEVRSRDENFPPPDYVDPVTRESLWLPVTIREYRATRPGRGWRKGKVESG